MTTVGCISVTPVKGFRLLHPDEVELTREGVVTNRRFFLVDGDGNRLRSSKTAWPIHVEGDYDAAGERLWMRFPDGCEVEAPALASGTEVQGRWGERVVAARVVDGPWEERLARLAGHPVRVVRPERPGECFVHVATLVSRASVERLSRAAGTPVDERRFRLLFALDGVDRPFAEDAWDGRRVRVGDAVLRVRGPVDRCAATTRHPDTGERDLDTLGVIERLRGVSVRRTLDFGVYADVVTPGRVRAGDPVEVLP